VAAEQIYPIMIPLTTNMDICGSFFDTVRTKPMDAMAPRNAAMIMTQEFMMRPCPRNRIIKIETTSFAPEEIPRTKGPAMGFEKKVCRRNPDTESAPPRIRAASILGRRISKRIWRIISFPSSAVRAARRSAADTRTLPTARLRKLKAASRANSSRYARTIRFDWDDIGILPLSFII